MTITTTPYQDSVLQHFADLSQMPLQTYADEWFAAAIKQLLEPTFLEKKTTAFVSALKADATHARALALVANVVVDERAPVLSADGVIGVPA